MAGTLRPAETTQWLQSTYAVVLAGGRGTRLSALTQHRSKPAMPFGGKYRIIDFTLSNCINSGVRRVGVLTQYMSQSLIRHVTRGWGFLDAGMGEFVDVIPAQQRTGEGWYSGTANAVYQNLDMLCAVGTRYVLVLAGDHVYKMDYSRMVSEHVRRGADVTVACTEVSLDDARSFGVLQVDPGGQVVGFEEKPAHPAPMPQHPGRALASMGVYVFGTAFLCDQLEHDAVNSGSRHDFGRDILPGSVSHARVCAHDFRDSCVNMLGEHAYWRDVGTVDAYWEANIDLTRPLPELNLYDDAWPIRSVPQQLPPAKFVFDDEGRRGLAVDSLVASGCIVSGATIRRSVLFSKVRVDDGSLVEDSLVLPGAVVGRGVVLRRAIVDKRCVLPDGLRIGVHPDEDRARFEVSEKGVTVVTAEMLEHLRA